MTQGFLANRVHSLWNVCPSPICSPGPKFWFPCPTGLDSPPSTQQTGPASATCTTPSGQILRTENQQAWNRVMSLAELYLEIADWREESLLAPSEGVALGPSSFYLNRFPNFNNPEISYKNREF